MPFACSVSVPYVPVMPLPTPAVTGALVSVPAFTPVTPPAASLPSAPKMSLVSTVPVSLAPSMITLACVSATAVGTSSMMLITRLPAGLVSPSRSFTDTAKLTLSGSTSVLSSSVYV